MYQILIAEDNPTICKGISACVDTEMPVHVTALAYNGEQAKEIIQNTKVDILISDIRMPKCSGLELASWIQQNHPEIPTIILTSYNDFDYARQALKSGCIDYLLKPTDPDELNQAIKKAISYILQQSPDKKNISPSRLLYDLMHGHEPVDTVPPSLLSGRYCVISVKYNSLPVDMPSRWQTPEWDLYYMPEPGFANFLFEFHQPMDPETYTETAANHIRSLSVRHREQIKAAGIGKLVPFNELNRSRKSAQDALFEGLFITGRSEFTLHSAAALPLNMSHELSRDNSRFRYAFSTGNKKEAGNIIGQNFRRFMQSYPCYTTCRTICNHYLSLAAGLSSVPYNEETIKQYSSRSFYLAHQSLEEIVQGLTEQITERMIVSTAEKSGGQQLSLAVRDFIHEHFDSQLSLQTLADLFQISPNYLATQYKTHIGKTVMTEIADVRLKHATGLLESTRQSIPEIAASLGYQSTEYFFRVFKKKFHITPGQYRNQHSDKG